MGRAGTSEMICLFLFGPWGASPIFNPGGGTPKFTGGWERSRSFCEVGRVGGSDSWNRDKNFCLVAWLSAYQSKYRVSIALRLSACCRIMSLYVVVLPLVAVAAAAAAWRDWRKASPHKLDECIRSSGHSNHNRADQVRYLSTNQKERAGDCLKQKPPGGRTKW